MPDWQLSVVGPWLSLSNLLTDSQYAAKAMLTSVCFCVCVGQNTFVVTFGPGLFMICFKIKERFVSVKPDDARHLLQNDAVQCTWYTVF